MAWDNKREFEALARRLLDPLLPLFSPGGARLHAGDTGVTYDRAAVGLEGFSRPLWALGPFWAGGGRDRRWEALYQAGLAAGTDPADPEYWGDPNDYDQRFVEMAAIACALIEAPQVVWEPLSERARGNLARWLGAINGHELPDCNWLFFRVLVNLALDGLGRPADPTLMEDDLRRIDSWYVGDGWYTDGPPEDKPQRDYYIPWALQYYGVLYSVFAARRDSARAAAFRERAMDFGKSFAHWFDANGAALPYGRSLTYRFGQAAFYSACIWAGLEPLPMPVMKGIVVRNLEWWLSHPIFDRDGVLTIGYCYPNLYMSERYNSPASPYWGMKTFLLLALPEDHPFWSAEAAPLPPEIASPGVFAQRASGLLFQRLPDGQVNAYAPGLVERGGHGQFPEKYAKFCYNTRLGFSASRSYAQVEQTAPDSMLAFVLPEGEGGMTYVRRHSEEYLLRDDRLISRWQPLPGIRVVTELIPCEGGHLRRHTVVSRVACAAYDCGFAVPRFRPDAENLARGHDAWARGGGLSCSVSGREGKGVVLEAWPNTSLYTPNTVIPAVRYAVRPGTAVIETKVTSAVEAEG